MASLNFKVGKRGQTKVGLAADLPALSKHPLREPIPYKIKLPSGQVQTGKIKSPFDLMLLGASIALQHAVRDLVFPEAASPSNGAAKRGSEYEE